MTDNPADSELNGKKSPRQELREKIVRLRKQRDTHQIDESDYIDGVLHLIDEYVAGVIGEDELHQDTSFGGTLPKFETVPMKHRNGGRAEQRRRAGIGGEDNPLLNTSSVPDVGEDQ